MSPAERVAQTVSAPAEGVDLPRQCRCCGAVLTAEEWPRLAYVGLMSDGEDGELELRNHGCGTTLAREVP